MKTTELKQNTLKIFYQVLDPKELRNRSITTHDELMKKSYEKDQS